MKNTQRRMVGLLSIAAVAAFGLSACSMDSNTDASQSTGSSESSMAPSSSAMSDSSSMASESAMDPAANLVGTGCAAYAEAVPEGEGSVAGMAKDPVAVAASNNPLLTTLTKAVSGKLNKDVNLVDTLNGDQFTVFAPVDDAFKALPEKDLKAVVENADMLTKVLTYHVVPGQISPDDLKGEVKTVEGDAVKISGSGDDLMVNDAKVICGGVQTANATVYLVDSVLMPPSK
ncbi:fasciclin domain-containing protein [Glutamicibacter uratoxydans]